MKAGGWRDGAPAALRVTSGHAGDTFCRDAVRIGAAGAPAHPPLARRPWETAIARGSLIALLSER